MNKYLKLAGAIVCATLVLAIGSGRVFARLTGTDPGTDVFCVGPSALEVCVDVSGNVLPTTTNIGSLGTSALKFKDAFLAGNITVGGTSTVTGATTQTGALTVGATANLIKTAVSSVTVAGSDTIDVTGACGGLLRLTSSQSRTTSTTDTLTAPTAATIGCILYIVNVGPGGIITLDNNSHFNCANADVLLGTDDGRVVVNDGAKWVCLGSSDN